MQYSNPNRNGNNHPTPINSQSNLHELPSGTYNLPDEVNDAMEMIAHTKDPLRGRSKKNGWGFIQQTYDSNKIHNIVFNAERDGVEASDKDEEDIDFNRADHRAFLQTAKRRVEKAKKKMPPYKFGELMRSKPVARFNKVLEGLGDESDSETDLKYLNIGQ